MLAGIAMLGSTKTRKVATNIFLDKRCGEILFQQVASGYVLHFVQNGSSKNVLNTRFFARRYKKTGNAKNALYIPP